MVISLTASCIRWCMQEYACELMWTCLVWAVPSHRFNSATQTIYTDSEPPSRLPNSLMPSAKLRSANLPLCVFGVTRSGIEPRPPAPRADALTTVLSYAGAVKFRWEINLMSYSLYVMCMVLWSRQSPATVHSTCKCLGFLDLIVHLWCRNNILGIWNVWNWVESWSVLYLEVFWLCV